MRFRCPFCYYIISADEASRGYPVECSGCGKSVNVPAGKFDPGCVIGDFAIDRKLGAGAVGAVYHATQLSLNRDVALKILSADYTTKNGTKDFLREARSAAGLTHPNLVQALAVGEEDGICYLAMTYINGETLKARLRREGRIPVDEALHIVQQVAEALYYAWDEAKLIHRDVKPDNIMITDDGVVKLMDLGLALRQTEIGEKTDISGSPYYMSPEQFSGKKLDTRTDIYSLGITLYQLIAGRPPFRADSVKELAALHYEAQPEPLKRLVPGVPSAVDALFSKMTAKEPDKRFSSFEEVLKAIWTIRQKTAPNKSLVPDVHTISMKHLDYDKQHESSLWKEKTRYENAVRKSWRERFFTLLIGFSAGVILVLPILFLLPKGASSLPSGTPPPGLSEDTRVFFKLAGDKTLELDSRIERGRRILSALPAGAFPAEPLTGAALDRLVLELSLARLENERYHRSLSEAGKRATLLEDDLRKLRLEAEKLRLKGVSASQVPTLEKQIVLLKDQNAEHRKNIQKLEKELKSAAVKNRILQKQSDLLVLEKTELLKNALRLRILELQKDFRFPEVKVLTVLNQRRYPELSRWLTEKDSENMALERAWKVLTDSGIRFAGKPLDHSDSRIDMISGGMIDYYDETNALRQTSWRKLSEKTASRLLRLDPLFRDDVCSVPATFEFLRGNYGRALAADPKNKELAAVCSLLIRRGVEDVENAVDVNRGQAVVLARNLLSVLRGSPDYARVKHQLERLLHTELTGGTDR